MKYKFQFLIAITFFTTNFIMSYNYPYAKVTNNSDSEIILKISAPNKSDENWKLKNNQSVDLILLEKIPKYKMAVVSNNETKYIFHNIRDIFANKYPNTLLNKNAQAEIIIYNNPLSKGNLKVDFKLSNLIDTQRRSEDLSDFPILTKSKLKKTDKKVYFSTTENILRKKSPESWEHATFELKGDLDSSGKEEIQKSTSNEPEFRGSTRITFVFSNLFNQMKNSLENKEKYKKMIIDPEYEKMVENIDKEITDNRIRFKKTEEHIPLNIRAQENYEREIILDKSENKIKLREKIKFLQKNPEYIDILNQSDQLEWINKKFQTLRSRYLNKIIPLKELEDFGENIKIVEAP